MPFFFPYNLYIFLYRFEKTSQTCAQLRKCHDIQIWKDFLEKQKKSGFSNLIVHFSVFFLFLLVFFWLFFQVFKSQLLIRRFKIPWNYFWKFHGHFSIFFEVKQASKLVPVATYIHSFEIHNDIESVTS